MAKHKAKRVSERGEDSAYLYRGVRIERNTDVPSGYFGSWVCYLARRCLADSLRTAKTEIDQVLDARKKGA